MNTTVSQYPATNPEIIFPSALPALFTAGPTPGNGVVYDDSCSGPPTVEAAAVTQSPPNALFWPMCDNGEFPFYAGDFAELTGTADAVSAYVGDTGLTGQKYELDAYDSAGNLLGSATATTSSAGITTPISYRQTGVFTIAFVDIYLVGGNPDAHSGMTDFSVEWGGGAPAIALSSVTPFGDFAPGVTSQGTLAISRINGSDGDVTLSADVGSARFASVSFSPTVLAGTAATAGVTVTVAADAPVGTSIPVTLTAVPASPEVGSADVTTSFTIEVVAPFSVASEYPTFSVAPCSSASTDVETILAGGFAGTPINLAVADSGGTSDIASVALQNPSLSNPGDFNIDGVNTQSITATRTEAAGTSPVAITVTPSSGSFTEPPVTLTLDQVQPKISSVSPTYAFTPQSDQPGTLVTIDGYGFCPNAVVEFGNSDAVAQPASVNAAGTQITVRTPRLATDGPLTVENIPAGATTAVTSAISPQTEAINSYRNVNGYQFHNYTPHIVFSQMTEAFGEGQTYWSFNPCIIFDCTIHIRNPVAMLLNAIINASIGGANGGACFGFSLSTQRILMNQIAVSDFPNNSNGTINGLDTTHGPSGPLTDYINAMAASQFSVPFLTHWLADSAAHAVAGGSASATDVYNQIHAILAQGRYPLIALRDGGAGHVVVAYNLEGSPGSYYIDVYDSNGPFQSAKENGQANADFHESEVNDSRISVDSHGDWSLDSTDHDNKAFQGGMSGLVVTDPASLPQDPPMITDLTGLVDIVFGSAGPGDTVGTGAAAAAPSTITQISDSAGHTLFTASGGVNTNPGTRLDGAPFAPLVGGLTSAPAATSNPPMIVLKGSSSTLHVTVHETGVGPDTHTFVGNGLAAQVTTSSTPGITDTFTVAPASGAAGLATDAASRPVSITLIAAHGKGQRTARVSTTVFRGGGVTFAFNAQHTALSLVNHGRATTFRLNLSDAEPSGTPAVFATGPIYLGPHATASIREIRWAALTGSALTVTSGGKTLAVHNSYRPAARITITSVKAGKPRHDKIVLTIAARVSKLSAGAQIAFTWVVRRGRKIVATHVLVEPATTHRVSFSFKASQHATYTLTATATAITLTGVTTSLSQQASRQLRFRG